MGLDASSNAGKAFTEQQRLQQQALDLQREGLNYYQRYGQQSDADRNTARQGNQAYGDLGLQDRNLADYNLGDLYSQYARAMGIQAPLASLPSQQPQTPVRATNRTTPNTGARSQSAAAVLNRNQAGVNAPAIAPAPTPSSPYNLSEVQQQSLNQGVDRINAQRQTALANYRAQAAQSGMSINPAMEQYINEHYDTLTNEQTTQAAERAREQVAQAAAALIQQFTNQRNIGTAQYGDSLDRTLQIASQALSQGANAPYFGAAGQTQNLAAQQGQIGQYNQQLANQSFGDLIQLIAFGASGGFGNLFGGGAAAGAATAGGSPITLPINWGL